jgi:transcription initiation factor TFIIIB Brf1 subunit/transcription initiation factor TFIIB
MKIKCPYCKSVCTYEESDKIPGNRYKCKKCGDVFKLPPLEELPNKRVTVHREKIPVGVILEAVCSWAGCGRTIFAHNVLPAGWKVIVVARGSCSKHRIC